MGLLRTTADENAPYPPTLGEATHPQNWGAGGYFQGSGNSSCTTDGFRASGHFAVSFSPVLQSSREGILFERIQSWLEISVDVSLELAEAVSELFNRYTQQPAGRGGAVTQIHGFDPEGDEERLYATVSAYLPNSSTGRETLRQVEIGLGHLSAIMLVPEPTVREVAEEEWADKWKESYQPIQIGQRLLIVPFWLRETTPVAPEQVAIELDPGMAFGTGLHPTTRLALRLLEEAVQPTDIVLDVGTGSGILSIAAVKLGAAAVLATDVDEVSISTAAANVRHNGVAERVSVQIGSLPRPPRPFDLVLVNILPHVILELFANGLRSYVGKQGRLILSGIIEPHLPNILDALQQSEMEVEISLQEGDWIGVLARPH